MDQDVIQIKNLSFRYRTSDPYVLNDINLTIRSGEWVSIIGHNGSGKSTLAKFLNALFIPSEDGEVIIDGMDTKLENLRQRIRQTTAMVFQNPDNQLVAPTVEDDVAFGLENAGVPHHEMVERVKESITKLGLNGMETREPHRLSGGQKQRVALAGAIAMRPEILVLDEATSMLDPMGRKEILDQVKLLKYNENMTIVTITHDLTEAGLADRTLVMKEGKIIGDASPTEIFNNSEMLAAARLKRPFIIEIVERLRVEGIDLSRDVVSEEELVKALCKLKQKT